MLPYTFFQVIEQLLQRWSHDIQLVSGRPRHPQSQGAVERAHYTLERKLTVKIHQDTGKSPPWTAWLPQIVCKLLIIIKILFAARVPVLHIIHFRIYRCDEYPDT